MKATRTLAIERLFAEALTQTGQTQQAYAWWVHLADVRSAEDFRILIRCAETETAFGNDPDKAEERIESARKAAGDNVASIALTKMLESELAIRRSNFDKARSILEQVVRSAETASQVHACMDLQAKPKPQWSLRSRFGMPPDMPKSISRC